MKAGDKVRILRRDPSNRTGTDGDWRKPNGDVGKIGYIFEVNDNPDYKVQVNLRKNGGYLGYFPLRDLELVTDNPTYEIY